MILILAIILPIVTGVLLPVMRLKARARNLYMMVCTLLTSVLVAIALTGDFTQLELISLNKKLSISLHLDDLGKVFSAVIALLWPLTLLDALSYMKDAVNQTSFFTFFQMSYGVTLGIAMSANLLTLYIFYELMTLSTLPLVLHSGSAKSVKAGLKYLYYSLGGSAFAFIGLVYLVYFGGGTDFLPGGLFVGVGSQHTVQLQLGYLLCFLGFGVKAAIFPVHGWLPTAAVAPTPVTALLHAVAVVKSGVFAIIRVTYFSFGTSVLEGSYAQYISLALSAFTIVFGSAMALKERHLKRRLAYSTVANLSYILFGALLMSAQGLYAGLMHLVFHALMKITLFLVVGVFNRRAHAYYIEDVRGIAKALPVLAVVFVIGSLAMTGIPPLIGFVSKWSLAEAAILSGGLLPLLGVSALLISAVLTGIYLIVPAVTMYTRPPVILAPQKVESGFYVTLLALSAMIIALSFYSGPLLDFLYQTALGAI